MLSQDEQYLYIDPPLMRLMLILMISDSGSYTFLLLGDLERKNREIFTLYNIIQVQQWLKHHNQNGEELQIDTKKGMKVYK